MPVNENAIRTDKPQVEKPPAAPRRTEVVHQLERILRSPAFNKSLRYSAFLRYCVEQALDGKGDQLKERTIGVDVFDRRPDYDPGSDHVVRSAAAEVRRRLAQYYQGGADPGELRIEILPGSYLPQFSYGPNSGQPLAETPLIVVPDEPPVKRSPRWRRRVVAPAIAFAAVLLALLWYRPGRVPTGVEWFWLPLLSAPRQVTIFIGPPALVSADGGSSLRGDADATVETVMKANVVSFASAASAAKISEFLQARGKASQVLSSVTSKYDDLQRGPAVLLGGLNNAWTLRLTDSLRFGFDTGDPGNSRIRDHQRPDQDWTFTFRAPYQKLTRDYALISRVLHPATEQMTLIVAGLGQWGTLGAVDFITDPVRLEKLRGSAGNRQHDPNVQVVIGVDVVDGAIGPPKVLATYFW
ncbi:MAG: hypothetical protein C5B51_08275 [Terriglobia bacterium]|nr:MAG: hypothetical protein C5B51_08275 [Terriglobia bacterium]